MERINRRGALQRIVAAGIAALGRPGMVRAVPVQDLRARIVALGIPGASAISPVGTFLPGGPIHDTKDLAACTQSGRILDPARILVGSRSNFGAPLGNPTQQEGSFLSIDPRGAETLVLPPAFAAAGTQVSILGGRVQLYSAQSPAFLNSQHYPSAVTATFTGVSNPLGISINNAFGRMWPANAPTDLDGIGTSTICDPDGAPLAGAPNPQAGGVFAGALTPRQPTQLLAGALNTGAVGTAFLGRSPDRSTKAVFSVVLADGSLVQVHAALAVDGLAPAGTVSPLLGQRWKGGGDDASPRLGVLLNYEPTRLLYVSEPFENSIAVLGLVDDGPIFRVSAFHRFHADALNQPVDLAPAMIEAEDPNWASNTTLEEAADFYVANRGDNTIVRMDQEGTVVAVRRVRLANGQALGNGRLNGIAVSPDGGTIWVTVLGQLAGQGNLEGAVLALPAFEA
jgi:hypothetical protein